MASDTVGSVGSGAVSFDGPEFRRVLGRLPTGVTVVTAAGEGRPVGVTIGSFVSISLEPALVGFFLTSGTRSLEEFHECGSFCVNILASDQQELSNLMASGSPDRFAGVEVVPSSCIGAPIFGGTLATIECELSQTVELGDHCLLVGSVLALSAAGEGKPLVYFGGGYGTFVADAV